MVWGAIIGAAVSAVASGVAASKKAEGKGAGGKAQGPTAAPPRPRPKKRLMHQAVASTTSVPRDRKSKWGEMAKQGHQETKPGGSPLSGG